MKYPIIYHLEFRISQSLMCVIIIILFGNQLILNYWPRQGCVHLYLGIFIMIDVVRLEKCVCQSFVGPRNNGTGYIGCMLLIFYKLTINKFIIYVPSVRQCHGADD